MIFYFFLFSPWRQFFNGQHLIRFKTTFYRRFPAFSFCFSQSTKIDCFAIHQLLNRENLRLNPLNKLTIKISIRLGIKLGDGLCSIINLWLKKFDTFISNPDNLSHEKNIFYFIRFNFFMRKHTVSIILEQ